MGQNLKIFEDLVLPSLKASPASKKKEAQGLLFSFKVQVPQTRRVGAQVHL